MNLPGPPPTESPELSAARGAAREGLGALRNLSQLLKSMRVGPKSIVEVLPDVQSSCGPLYDAFKLLLSETPGVNPVFREELDILALPRIRQLSETLSGAAKGPLRATRRIDLESKVTLALRDLGVARTLLDLVHESADGRSVAVDAEELVRESGTLIDATSPGIQKVSMSIVKPAEPVLVLVNPRATMGLLALLAGLASTRSGSPLRLTITAGAEGECRFRFSKQSAPGTFTVVSPVPLAAAAATATVISNAIGARVEDDEDSFSVTVSTAFGA